MSSQKPVSTIPNSQEDVISGGAGEIETVETISDLEAKTDTHIADFSVDISVEEEASVRKKIDLRILPIILAAYFLQQLDKSTLNYSSIFGITEDAHLHGKEFSWLGSALYLSQLVAQPLAALTLVKLPTGKVIAGAVFLWGSSLCIMSACTNFPSLLGLRICLGIFESLIAPSLIAVTQMWWRRREQTLRTVYWSGMNGLTFIVGSLFTYGLGHIKSRVLFSYQIIFLFCGLLTVVYSLIVLAFMPDSPFDTKFLTERERFIAIERLKANQMGIVERKWKWEHVREVLYDLKTWFWFFLVMAISIPSGGIGTFGTLIIKSFGYSNFQTILFNIPFGVVQMVSIIGSGWLATKLGRKGPVIALLTILPIIGTVMLLRIHRSGSNKGVLLFAYYIISVYPGITPLIFAWEAQNTAGDTKRKCATGLMFIGLCTGNVIGPLLYDPSQAPLYRPGLIGDLCMFVLVGILTGVTTLYLVILNRSHAKKRVLAGKSAEIVDLSMSSKRNPEVEKSLMPTHNGLDDVTDLKNEDFVYLY